MILARNKRIYRVIRRKTWLKSGTNLNRQDSKVNDFQSTIERIIRSVEP